MEPLIRVSDLEVHFPLTQGALMQRAGGTVRAVDGVSFDIHRGETLGLVGESGSGKSTIGRAMLGIDRPSGGSIHFDQVDITRLSGRARKPFARRMQMIFQDSYASVDPRMKVAEIVAEPLAIHGEGVRSERRARVVELLDLVGLPERFAGAYPHQLSGGQRQRVGIARALALRPDFIICDESVSALDVSIQAQILNLLLDLQQRFGLTYLFIGHDIAVIRYMARRILVMYRGRLMELGESEALVAAPLHPYTKALMASVPLPDPPGERRRRAVQADQIALAPAATGATTAITGCPFAPRCPRVAEAWAQKGMDCHTRRPPLAQAAPGRAVACHLYDGTAA
ncbi:MAG TPA: oligopeptide/dipeptide ABC transporter ATP-binding protein [Nordella sp.]|nr:oligopeptide/dipeptide ABC transporter ATP-binding protein [Nordella sp.]